MTLANEQKNSTIIAGPNGSGKTSLLEAIYMLAMGRSFRSRSLKNAVNKEAQRLTVFARSLDQRPIGLQYDLASGLQIRLNINQSILQ